MICLVSVVQFFVIIAFYSIDKDIGLLVFGTLSLFMAQLLDIGFCRSFAIIAFQGIDEDIGFVGFWNIIAFYSIAPGYWFFVGLSPSSLFKAQTRILVLLVFGSSSLFTAQFLDIGFLLVFRHHRFLGHRRGYWFCSVF